MLPIEGGWPPAYARAAATDGPATVVMFRSAGPELAALVTTGAPFFGTPWRADEVGVRIDASTDWGDLAELLTESYCLLAPAKLAKLVDRPDG